MRVMFFANAWGLENESETAELVTNARMIRRKLTMITSWLIVVYCFCKTSRILLSDINSRNKLFLVRLFLLKIIKL